MKCDIRREEILKDISNTLSPISASILSEKFGVSRQIIVKDIAKLKAEGHNISSLSRGYIMNKQEIFKRVFKIFHSDEDVKKELNMIVDLGGTVENVFIYHKVYNKVSARMDIKSRLDVENFLADIASGKSSLLKNVTSGYHYHTISAKDEKILDLIELRLTEEGFIAPLKEYEPAEIFL